MCRGQGSLTGRHYYLHVTGVSKVRLIVKITWLAPRNCKSRVCLAFLCEVPVGQGCTRHTNGADQYLGLLSMQNVICHAACSDIAGKFVGTSCSAPTACAG